MSTTFLARPDGSTALLRPRTRLNIVADESSSMASQRAQTITAVNKLVDDHRGFRVDELFVTLTLFSDAGRVRVVWRSLPIMAVPQLTAEVYRPQGNTALRDGIYKTLIDMEPHVEPGDRVLTVVITDGQENHSREITSDDALRRIVEYYEGLGNWTFTLLSAKTNAFRTGGTYGFAPGNIRVYDPAAGVEQALQRVSDSVAAYRTGDGLNTAHFWEGDVPPTREAPEWVPETDPDL